MGKDRLIGVDLGTGACKTVVMDASGNILGRASEEYPTYYPGRGWAEQEPEDWYRAFCSSLQQAIKQACVPPELIGAVSLDGATHTVALLDGKKDVVRKAILWTDKRTKAQAEKVGRHFGDEVLRITHNAPGCAWTIAHLLWIRDAEPAVWDKAVLILPVKDYVRYRITGEVATDYIEAVGTMLADANTFEWSRRLCEFAGVNLDMLPPIVSPSDIVGCITKQGAEDTGLLEGTPVVAGAPDTAVEMFGAGAMHPGDFTVKLATSGRICVVADRPFAHPEIVTYPHLVKGRWYPGTGTTSCATSYRWFRDAFYSQEGCTLPDREPNAFQVMDIEAARCPAGSEGLIFHPYLLGEGSPYYDPDLRGDFLGITVRHRRRHFARAVLEGTAFSLRDCVGLLRALGIQMGKGRLIGGGAQSNLWGQIVADVLDMELIRMEASDAAFGAAMLAGVGGGVFNDLEDAVARCVKVRDPIVPNRQRARVYAGLFDIYKQTVDALRELNHRLSTLAKSLDTEREVSAI
ncbi:MAG: FGGY family carbohydrate kinase [Bacillota bacterium]